MPSTNLLGLIVTVLSSTVSPAMLDPDMGFPCDGKRVGLTDSHKHEILAAKYSRIDYLGHGLFNGWDVNPGNKFEYGLDRFLFNRSGVKLPARVPPGGRFVQVFWLGSKADADPDLLLTELPDETILRFTEGRKFGLCTTRGEVILPAEYGFIGKACGGIAFVTENVLLTSGDKSFYVFDCAQRSLKELPFKQVREANGLHFNEGLAAFPGQPNERTGRGYIDKTGAFVIAPQFGKAGPFINGIAAVESLSRPEGESSKMTIDKSGKIISPINMEVQQFYGEFAVARQVDVTPPRYGVVNRRFEYVLEPKYATLSPQENPYDYAILETRAQAFSKSPLFYSATEGADERQKIISPTGTVLLTLPERHYFNGLLPDGLLSCYVKPIDLHDSGEKVVLTMKGEQVPNPYARNSLHQDYLQIAPDRLVRKVDIEDGKFDSASWKNGQYSPISREEMFIRFRHEHTLLGMSKSDVLRYLGPGVIQADANVLCYRLDWARHSDKGQHAVIYIKDGKVESLQFQQDLKLTRPEPSNLPSEPKMDSIIRRADQLIENKSK